jgi:NADH-quinone oxidoreductase subunit F
VIDLGNITRSVKKAGENITKRIIVCAGKGCVVSVKVFESFVIAAKELGVNVCVELKEENSGILLFKSDCQGFCRGGSL